MNAKYSDVAIASPHTLYNADAILQSIKTALYTQQGERIFANETGSKLDDYLWVFANEDTAKDIMMEIKRIVMQDSRASLEELVVLYDERNNTYEVTLAISVDNEVASDVFELKSKGI